MSAVAVVGLGYVGLPLAVHALQERGAQVTVVDPYVTDWTVTPMLTIEDLGARLGDFPLVIIMTDHGDFDYEKVASLAAMVLDCRNIMRPSDNVVAL